MIDPQRRNAAGLVAVVLAVAMGTALNIITLAILYAAFIRAGYDINAGISDKGVQVLLAWGGGIISVLAGYVGFIVGKMGGAPVPPPEPEPPEPPLPER